MKERRSSSKKSSSHLIPTPPSTPRPKHTRRVRPVRRAWTESSEDLHRISVDELKRPQDIFENAPSAKTDPLAEKIQEPPRALSLEEKRAQFKRRHTFDVAPRKKIEVKLRWESAEGKKAMELRQQKAKDCLILDIDDYKPKEEELRFQPTPPPPSTKPQSKSSSKRLLHRPQSKSKGRLLMRQSAIAVETNEVSSQLKRSSKQAVQPKTPLKAMLPTKQHLKPQSQGKISIDDFNPGVGTTLFRSQGQSVGSDKPEVANVFGGSSTTIAAMVEVDAVWGIVDTMINKMEDYAPQHECCRNSAAILRSFKMLSDESSAEDIISSVKDIVEGHLFTGAAVSSELKAEVEACLDQLSAERGLTLTA